MEQSPTYRALFVSLDITLALMSERVPPPAVLDSARVLSYAFVDDIPYHRAGALYVGDKLLEAVPRLAICANLGQDMGALLFHCDDGWTVLGVSGGDAVAEAKKRAERNYPGVSARWIDLSITHEGALELYDREPENARCLFCRRRPFEFGGCVDNGEGARICNECIERFHAIIQGKREGDADEG